MNALNRPALPHLFDDASRLAGQIDVTAMASATVAVFGTGGAAGVLAQLAALKLGHVIVVEPDIVTASNVTTSAFSTDAVGRSKALVVADIIRTINPACEIDIFECRDDELSDAQASYIWQRAKLVLSMTDDPCVQARLNRLSILHHRDMLTGAVGADNRMWELHANLFPEVGWGLGCLRCFALERLQTYEQGRSKAPFYPSHRLIADWINLAIAYAAVGLIHYRAGSREPVAAYGKTLTEAPFLFGLVDPALADGQHPVFGDLPTGRTLFATRQMARPIRSGWVCPDCGAGNAG